MTFLYDNDGQRDTEVIRFINEGLAGGQLCIYGTVRLQDKGFKAISSKITDYDENVKNGNLWVVDFVPFYIAALNNDLAPYKQVHEQLEEMLKAKKDTKVRFVGDATGFLFENKHFDECIMIEDWWQRVRSEQVTTLCLFQKSLMHEFPFSRHKKRVLHAHDVALEAEKTS